MECGIVGATLRAMVSAPHSLSASKGSTKVRFGDFEYDSSCHELRKGGIRVRIQKQPLAILLKLLESPGSLVTRDELYSQLWDSTTFVAFEHGVNSAMKRLRDALCDSADHPRYIETVPGEGYRLITPVERLEARPMASAILVPAEQPVDHAEFILRWRDDRRWLWAGGLALLATIAGLTTLPLLHLGQHSTKEAVRVTTSPVRIAVLPFVNLTGDPSKEYLCDGITEEMISGLGAVSPGRLDVIARTSAMHYKNTLKTIREIGQELKVGYVLESSVRKSGIGLRVTAQLVRASDASNVWAGEFDLKSDDEMGFQQEAAAAIADSIKVTLSSSINARSPVVRTSDPEAYRDYLLGRYYWNKRSREGLQTARTYFERAIERDPKYARAYLGLADDYLVLGAGMMPEEVYPRAKAAAMKALEIDNQLAEAYSTVAYEEFIDEWDWQESEANYRRSLALDPNYATAHEWYAIFLAAMRRNDEAVKEIDRALELDPLSLAVNYNASSIYLQSGRNVEAFELAKKSLEIDPHSTPAHYALGAVYEKTGRYSDAISEFRAANRDDGRSGDDSIIAAHSYAMAGNRAKAFGILRHWLPLVDRPPGNVYYGVAIVYAALGEKDQAFLWLRKAVENRSCSASEINTDWRLDPLRADSRFAEIRAQFRLSN